MRDTLTTLRNGSAAPADLAPVGDRDADVPAVLDARMDSGTVGLRDLLEKIDSIPTGVVVAAADGAGADGARGVGAGRAAAALAVILAAGLGWSLYAYTVLHRPDLTTSGLLNTAFTNWPVTTVVLAIAFWELGCAVIPEVPRSRAAVFGLLAITAGHLTWVLNLP